MIDVAQSRSQTSADTAPGAVGRGTLSQGADTRQGAAGGFATVLTGDMAAGKADARHATARSTPQPARPAPEESAAGIADVAVLLDTLNSGATTRQGAGSAAPGHSATTPAADMFESAATEDARAEVLPEMAGAEDSVPDAPEQGRAGALPALLSGTPPEPQPEQTRKRLPGKPDAPTEAQSEVPGAPASLATTAEPAGPVTAGLPAAGAAAPSSDGARATHPAGAGPQAPGPIRAPSGTPTAPGPEQRPAAVAQSPAPPVPTGVEGGAAPLVAAPAPAGGPAVSVPATTLAAPLNILHPDWPSAAVSASVGTLLPDGGSMTIDLAPDDLGQLRITIAVEGDSASVRFQTDTPEAARALAEAERQLSAELARHGLTLAAHDAAADRRGTPQQGVPQGRSGEAPGAAAPTEFAASPVPGLVNLIA